jgi:trans-aconitate 2-methyltransferase
VADPQFAWGRRLLERLQLRGDETAIDAGCGSGRLTRLLAERLPRGRVIAIDASEEMVEATRRHLEPDFGAHVDYLRSDLLDLQLHGVADVVFSTATFHWISDQSALYRRLAAALKHGGRLLAQMGGKGNIDRLRRRSETVMAQPDYQRFFAGWEVPWVYPDEETTRDRLEAAGFTRIEVELFPEPTTFPDRDRFREFITAVNFRLHLQRIASEPLQREFIERIIEMAAHDDPPYTLDYWRLNLSGTRE